MDKIIERLKLANDDELLAFCEVFGIDKKYKDNFDLLANEYRLAAGHSLMNLYRNFSGEKLPYKQILIDVADKLKPGLSWTSFTLNDNSTEEEIENEIEKFFLKIVEDKWKSLSQKERERFLRELQNKAPNENELAVKEFVKIASSGGLAAALASNTLAVSLFYSGFFQTIWVSIFGVSILHLIISGALIFLPISVFLLMGPAYRKTIPATFILIKIRRRIEAEKLLKEKNEKNSF